MASTEEEVNELYYCDYQVPRFAPRDPFVGVIRGENDDVFNAIGIYVRQMAERGVTYRFGLFGPPSVGKTMTSQRIAISLQRPFAARAAGNFKSFNDIRCTHRACCGGTEDGDLRLWVAEMQGGDADPTVICKPSVIFIDEAHALSKEMQTVLLSLTEEPYQYTFDDLIYDFRHVCFIFATTDPSDMVKPLRTRLIEATFMPYSEQSIAEIVAAKYPGFDEEEALLIAKAAKAIPRKALQMGNVLQNCDDVAEELFRCFGADEDGYDRTDTLIINYLKTQTGSITKRRESELLIEAALAGARVSQLAVGKAQAFLETVSPYKPVGIQAIAHALGYTDSEDIFTRIMWLETKGIVKRLPPRGVMYSGE